MSEYGEDSTLEITIEPQHQAGVWANFARVIRSEHEFTIDFGDSARGRARPELEGVR